MKAIWTKKNGGNIFLNIIRQDGSSTYTKLHASLPDHDLAHYAVERTLKMKHAFFGLVNKGVDTVDFMMEKDKKPPPIHPDTIHPEAIVTEHVVNLLQIEYFQHTPQSEFLNQLRSVLNEASLPFPKTLSEAHLESIRKTYHSLAQKLSKLPEGEKIELEVDWI